MNAYCRCCGRRTAGIKKRTKRPNSIISNRRGAKRKPNTHVHNRKIKSKIRILHADERRLVNSPLCISYNRQTTLDDASRYKEITPDMIHDALQKLTEMRESVPFEVILKYLKANYSVNQNEQALRNELERKLYTALRIGLVYVDRVGQWRLQSELEQLRQVPDSLVTIFWETYLDTIRPLPMKKRKPLQPLPNKKSNDSDSDSLPSDDYI